MSVLSLIPWYFWVLALSVSVLHTIPGWIYGLYSFANALNQANDTQWKQTVERHKKFWRWVYCLHHAFIYFTSSFSGFVALYAALAILDKKLAANLDFGASTGVVIVALFILAIAGISGVLARILYHTDKIPGFGGGLGGG